jgi:hypothetical protein
MRFNEETGKSADNSEDPKKKKKNNKEEEHISFEADSDDFDIEFEEDVCDGNCEGCPEHCHTATPEELEELAGKDKDKDMDDLLDDLMTDCPMSTMIDAVVGATKCNPLGSTWDEADMKEFLGDLGYRILDLTDEYGTLTVALKESDNIPEDLDSPECDAALVKNVFAKEYKELTKKVIKKLNRWVSE